jgi:hypothetical protein
MNYDMNCEWLIACRPNRIKTGDTLEVWDIRGV